MKEPLNQFMVTFSIDYLRTGRLLEVTSNDY